MTYIVYNETLVYLTQLLKNTLNFKIKHVTH